MAFDINQAPELSAQDVVIADGQTVSATAEVGGAPLTAIQTPAGMTGTTLTFNGSFDGTTFFPIRDTSNADISVTVDTTARIYALKTDDFAGIPYIQVVSGSAESGAKTIKLVSVAALNKD